MLLRMVLRPGTLTTTSFQHETGTISLRPAARQHTAHTRTHTHTLGRHVYITAKQVESTGLELLFRPARNDLDVCGKQRRDLVNVRRK